MAADTFEPLDQLAAAMLLQQYAWASDQRDRAGLQACFTPAAAVWLAGRDSPPVLAVEGSASIAQWVIERHRSEFAAGHIRRHLVAFPVLIAGPDHLLARSYFTVLLWRDDDLQLGAMGWFEDELVKDEASWQIRRRVVHIDARGGPTAQTRETRP
jgi:hypothetical protein